jgi:hypothetical protein
MSYESFDGMTLEQPFYSDRVACEGVNPSDAQVVAEEVEQPSMRSLEYGKWLVLSIFSTMGFVALFVWRQLI